jgi:hypothetical protein
MRFGNLAIYQGRAYRLGRYDEAMLNLVSEDSTDLANGFTVYAPGVYIKSVPRAEVEDVFRVSNFGEYQGVRVEILQEKDGLLLVEASQELPGFRRTDKFLWERWVKHEELTRIWEQRKSI